MRGNRQAFFDTNILIYAFAEDDPRTETAETLLERGGVIGVQTLNEFVAIAVRTLAMSWQEVLEAVSALRVLCPSPAPMTLKTHELGLRIAGQYKYHIYDSLVIAAALETSCSILYAEDMQHGQVIEGLTIRNPFRGSI